MISGKMTCQERIRSVGDFQHGSRNLHTPRRQPGLIQKDGEQLVYQACHMACMHPSGHAYDMHECNTVAGSVLPETGNQNIATGQPYASTTRGALAETQVPKLYSDHDSRGRTLRHTNNKRLEPHSRHMHARGKMLSASSQ